MPADWKGTAIMTRSQQLCYRYIELARQNVDGFNHERVKYYLACAIEAAEDLTFDAAQAAPEHAAIEEP